MILWRVLTEVFERGQSSFAELHLIEDYQGLLLDDGLTCDVGQNWNQIIGADVFLKSLVQLGIGLKIEIGDVFVVCAPELQMEYVLPTCLAPCKIRGLRCSSSFHTSRKLMIFLYIMQPP